LLVRSPETASASSSAPPVPDAGLVHTLRGGDPRAATELYARYAGRMRALVASRLRGPVASRLSPDDIVQSVFRTFF
jgi:RNA polymerase sigma-70 factor, ECF subfamily